MGAQTTTIVKRARKQHQCEWCGEACPAGESYKRISGIDIDGSYSYALHAECSRAMAATPSWEIQDGWPFGGYVRGSVCEKGCGCDEHALPKDPPPSEGGK
jgi:hypothetical protein